MEAATDSKKPLEDFLINKELLKLVLKKEVDSIKIENGTNPGDNYMSIINAVEVKLRDEDEARHILIKCYPNSAGRRDFLDECDAFGKEFIFYKEWAPALMELASKSKAGHLIDRLSIPEFLGGNYTGCKDIHYPEPWSKENFVVMTDLRKTYGFKMADREEGLDFEHANIALKELATLHALSWCYKSRNGIDKLTSVHPQMVDVMSSNDKFEEQFKPLMDHIHSSSLKFIEETVGPDSPILLGAAKLLSVNITRLMTTFINVDGVDEDYANNLMRIPNNAAKDGFQDSWLLGCHGDFWVNNILFRYDPDNKPIEAVLLDLQVYREACPTTDLVYFFYSSTTLAVRRPHEEALLTSYYDQFQKICQQLNCQPLPGWSFENLKLRFRRAKIFGFLLAMPVLSVVLKPPQEAVELDSVEGDVSEMFASVMEGGDTNTRLRRRIVEIATELYEDGIF